MGISIVLPNANFKHYVASLTLPNRDGLIGEYILGGSAGKSIVNYANQAAPATEIGAPSYSDHYGTAETASTPVSKGWETGIACPDAVTLLAVARKVSNFAPILAMKASAADYFSGFVNFSNKPAFYNTQNGAASTVASFNLPSHSNFFLLAGKGALGGYGAAHLWTDGVRADVTAPSPGVNNTTHRRSSTLATGKWFSAAGVGTTDIAYLAAYSRLVGTDELDAIYAGLKSFYDGKIVIS